MINAKSAIPEILDSETVSYALAQCPLRATTLPSVVNCLFLTTPIQYLVTVYQAI